ncbi:hypothetical protein Q75_13920 [Bacillus coahuilensis p1.1.43]|uniref:Uncharacterized protein n=1 Tax=Bacillus coahuilensis p1.1.43 TaxID=1150625 RepID=A0A147K5K5_9BACI|nr:hypothetical protein [Bacillus coahuilensis]KUP04925.1 hypothetical protein Q75_13920 [Bacillus coahuilensis p1.1.43]
MKIRLLNKKYVNTDSAEKEVSVEPDKESKEDVLLGEPTYKLEGSATIEGNEISIQGHTNVPPGAIILARLRKYHTDSELEEIKDFRVEPFSNSEGEIYMEVSSEGIFNSTDIFERKTLSLRYRLELIFLPDRAQEEIQKRIIEDWGSLDNLSGMVPIDTFSKNQLKEPIVPGFIKYANVLKKDESGGDGVTIEFVSPDNVPN